jgi:drug/metabolite transporter (DMT)-like permease
MSPFLGGACALVSAAIWAFSATYMTSPARVWGGGAANLFKSTVGAAFFLASTLAVSGSAAFDASPEAWARFAASGLLGLAVADTAYLTSLRHIGPTLTAIVYQTSGIFTCALGVGLLHESLTVREIGGIGLVIVGVLLALAAHVPRKGGAPDDPHAGERGHKLRGAAFALVAAAFHAAGVVLNKDAFRELLAHDGTDGLPAAMFAGFARMTAAAVALFGFGALTGTLARQTRVFRERAGWRATFLPAFFGTFVAMITMQLALTSLKSGIASVLLSMTPVFTIPVEWWVLKQRPTFRSIAGAAIALYGAWLLTPGT